MGISVSDFRERLFLVITNKVLCISPVIRDCFACVPFAKTVNIAEQAVYLIHQKRIGTEIDVKSALMRLFVRKAFPEFFDGLYRTVITAYVGSAEQVDALLGIADNVEALDFLFIFIGCGIPN